MAYGRKVYFKLIGSAAVFVGFAVVFAWTMSAMIDRETTPAPAGTKRKTGRAPASVIYNDDGEPVMWDQSLDEFERDGRAHVDRGVHLSHAGEAILSPTSTLSRADAFRMSGTPVLRARKLSLNWAALTAALRTATLPNSKAIAFPLFEDRRLELRLSPSSFGVNAGMYSGQVEGVEGSRVRLFVSEGHLSGVIEIPGHRFRLIESPTETAVIVVEDDLQAEKLLNR